MLAWGSSFDQRQYYVAAHADEVWLHPMGTVHIEGYGRLRNYYRDALDKLGVTANVIRVGKFKSFGEPFIENAPSPAALEAESLLNEAPVAELHRRRRARAPSCRTGSLVRGIDDLPQRLAAAGGDLAKLALQAKLVDALKTRDELRQAMIERGARDEESRASARSISTTTCRA